MRCAKGPRSIWSNDNHSSRGGSSTSFLWTSVKCHWHCDPLLHAYAIFWRAIDGPPRELFCLFVCLFVCFLGGRESACPTTFLKLKTTRTETQKFHLVVQFSRKLVKYCYISHTHRVLKTLAGVPRDNLNAQLNRSAENWLVLHFFLLLSNEAA